MGRRPQDNGTARRSRTAWGALTRWRRGVPLTITVKHTGGPESWWLVKARGTYGYFPGHLALEDVMARVMNEE